jgi:hypothetical protein
MDDPDTEQKMIVGIVFFAYDAELGSDCDNSPCDGNCTSGRTWLNFVS